MNFTSEENALKFKEILQYYKWGNVKTEEGYFYMSKKICVVTWATIQVQYMSHLFHFQI